MDLIRGRDQKLRGTMQYDFDLNCNYLDQILKDCKDIVQKKFVCAGYDTIQFALYYTDGLTDTQLIDEMVIKPLRNVDRICETEEKCAKTESFLEMIETHILDTADFKEMNQWEEIVTAVLSGNTVLFVEKCNKALMFSSKKPPTRGVQEAQQEVVLRGPKDSFTESIRTNTALIRRRIRDSRLKLIQSTVGERSKSDVAIFYMEDLVREDILEEAKKRLKDISMDGIFDTGMVQQLMNPEWNSPFPNMQHTQRPDKTASALLEGRVAIFVDNSPEALIIPATLNTFFQASDDYYMNWESATFARSIRYAAAVLALILPGLYVAVAGFHTTILPTDLVLTLASARQGVPFPIVIEVLLMELEFELLREAGIRLPGQLGNTIGIVGGLIVGQAAVDAGLVSTIVVIIVALTAICSFAVPNETFMSAFRLLKFLFILFAAFFGLYGLFLGIIGLFIHLASLESYHVPYLFPTVCGEEADYDDRKDYHRRMPLAKMRKRPIFTRNHAKIRKRG